MGSDTGAATEGLKKEACLDNNKKDGDKKGTRNTEDSEQLTREGKETMEDEPNSADGDREKDGADGDRKKDGDNDKEGGGEEKKDDENGPDGDRKKDGDKDGERDEKGDEHDNAGADRDKKEDDKVVDTSTGPAFVIRWVIFLVRYPIVR